MGFRSGLRSSIIKKKKKKTTWEDVKQRAKVSEFGKALAHCMSLAYCVRDLIEPARAPLAQKLRDYKTTVGVAEAARKKTMETLPFLAKVGVRVHAAIDAVEAQLAVAWSTMKNIRQD